MDSQTLQNWVYRYNAGFPELVAQALPPQAASKPVEIWFQDEARVGQQGTLSYTWAE